MEVQALRPLADVDDESFRELVTISAATAAGRAPKRAPSIELSSSTLWPLHEALVGLFVEVARAGFPMEDVRNALVSVLPEARALAVLDLLVAGRVRIAEASRLGVVHEEVAD